MAKDYSSPVTSPAVTPSTTWRDELNESVAVEEPEIVKEIPESQKVGYMRIVGDLRWDQLTSKEEWKSRFPECLTDYRPSYENGSNQIATTNSLDNFFVVENPNTGAYSGKYTTEHRTCDNFSPASIPVNITKVYISPNSGTESKTMTSSVNFSFFDDSQSRAFKASLSQKYNYTSDGYCSTYTCWNLDDVDVSGDISASPTPYTVSLLDQVQLNTSDL